MTGPAAAPWWPRPATPPATLTAHDLMITGDAAVWENGGLVVANPQFCLDLPAAEASLARLKACRCRDYLCYHGGFGR